MGIELGYLVIFFYLIFILMTLCILRICKREYTEEEIEKLIRQEMNVLIKIDKLWEMQGEGNLNKVLLDQIHDIVHKRYKKLRKLKNQSKEIK